MNRRATQIGILLGTLIILSAGGYWWYSSGQRTPGYVGPFEKITIGAISSEFSSLVWIAESKGYFQENGLEITIKPYQSGPPAIKDLLEKNIDVASCSDFVLANKIFEGMENLRCMGAFAAVDNHWVVARKDRGITTPADLKGKKIGVTFATSGSFFLGVFLTFNRLTLDDVELVDVKPLEMKDGLADGKVDALITWEPNVWQIEKDMGEKVKVWPGQSGQLYYGVLVSTREAIESKAKAMDRLLMALARAEDLVKGKGEEAKAIVGRRLGFDDAYLNRVWPKTKYALSLDQTLLFAMEDEARWMIKNDMASNHKEVPDYMNNLYLNALSRARPQSVRLIATKKQPGN